MTSVPNFPSSSFAAPERPVPGWTEPKVYTPGSKLDDNDFNEWKERKAAIARAHRRAERQTLKEVEKRAKELHDQRAFKAKKLKHRLKSGHGSMFMASRIRVKPIEDYDFIRKNPLFTSRGSDGVIPLCHFALPSRSKVHVHPLDQKPRSDQHHRHQARQQHPPAQLPSLDPAMLDTGGPRGVDLPPELLISHTMRPSSKSLPVMTATRESVNEASLERAFLNEFGVLPSAHARPWTVDGGDRFEGFAAGPGSASGNRRTGGKPRRRTRPLWDDSPPTRVEEKPRQHHKIVLDQASMQSPSRTRAESFSEFLADTGDSTLNRRRSATAQCLQSIHQNDLLEICRMRSPPIYVLKLLGAVCALCYVPASWKDARQSFLSSMSLLTPLFAQSAANPPSAEVIGRVEELMRQEDNGPYFSLDEMSRCSKACVAIWRWVWAMHALKTYELDQQNAQLNPTCDYRQLSPSSLPSSPMVDELDELFPVTVTEHEAKAKSEHPSPQREGGPPTTATLQSNSGYDSFEEEGGSKGANPTPPTTAAPLVLDTHTDEPAALESASGYDSFEEDEKEPKKSPAATTALHDQQKSSSQRRIEFEAQDAAGGEDSYDESFDSPSRAPRDNGKVSGDEDTPRATHGGAETSSPTVTGDPTLAGIGEQEEDEYGADQDFE